MRRLWILCTLAPLGLTPFGSTAAECSCRANGRNYPLGETACLKTPEGGRLARCEMNLNNTSWVMTERPCVIAGGGAGAALGASVATDQGFSLCALHGADPGDPEMAIDVTVAEPGA